MIAMSSARHKYNVQTNVFNGPLDLLLNLIERAELDITTVSLALVTDQFLDYIHEIQERNAEEISGFLVIAAKLIQIKSAALLPRPPIIEPDTEEDEGEALVRQLLEYRKFKQAAMQLEEREGRGLRTYLRVLPPNIQVEPRIDLSDIDLNALLQAALELLVENDIRVPISEVANMPRVTIREKIDLIIKSFRENPSITFSQLLQMRTRNEIVITFLALLELVKQNIVEVNQSAHFKDILITIANDADGSKDLELEF